MAMEIAWIVFLLLLLISMENTEPYYDQRLLYPFCFSRMEFSKGKIRTASGHSIAMIRQSNRPYRGQGNHNLSVADVDDDGKDEIVFGAMTIDDNGKGLYSTGLGHGDALHVTDLDPTRPGLEVFDIQERFDDAGAQFDVMQKQEKSFGKNLL